ncbi:MAG: tetratricopeptide repeat protein, partial [Melioribacteraceae bacterium]|nr:tetratricopeptide repeat protein [Melioribacteraceae bacterium]
AANIYKELGNNKNLILLGNVSIYKYAEMLIMMDDLPVAIEILNELSNTGELNIFEDKSLFLLANVYQYGILDFKTAISIYQKLLEKFPNSLYLDGSRENIISLKTKLSENI